MPKKFRVKVLYGRNLSQDADAESYVCVSAMHAAAESVQSARGAGRNPMWQSVLVVKSDRDIESFMLAVYCHRFLRSDELLGTVTPPTPRHRPVPAPSLASPGQFLLTPCFGRSKCTQTEYLRGPSTS